MFNSRSISDLLPCVRFRAIEHIALCELQIPGLKILIASTVRDAEAQHELYMMGRRNILGERIITNADGGDSYHQYCVAYDVHPVLLGKSIFSLMDGDQVSDPIWQKIGALGEQCGLEWAGRWKKFPEGPHFQYTGGLSLEELKKGLRPSA